MYAKAPKTQDIFLFRFALINENTSLIIIATRFRDVTTATRKLHSMKHVQYSVPALDWRKTLFSLLLTEIPIVCMGNFMNNVAINNRDDQFLVVSRHLSDSFCRVAKSDRANLEFSVSVIILPVFKRVDRGISSSANKRIIRPPKMQRLMEKQRDR